LFAIHYLSLKSQSDTCTVIWDTKFVIPFQQPEVAVLPEHFERNNFKFGDYTAEERFKTIQNIDAVDKRCGAQALVDALIECIQQPPYGLYSNFQMNAIYERGYDDNTSIRLGFM
jgi:hypothetical protein